MQELQILRSSDFSVEVSLLPHWKPGLCAPTELTIRGDGRSVAIELQPHMLLIFKIIIMASIDDQARMVPEIHAGYITTDSIVRLYAAECRDVVRRDPEVIFRYISKIRRAVLAAKETLGKELGCHFEPHAGIIEHTPGMGYRIGDISIVVKDYRES